MAQNNTLKYILIGFGIAVGLGVCGVGSCIALFGGGALWAYEQLDAPAQEAKSFLLELSRGDAPAAYARTSKGFRARTSQQALSEAHQQNPALKDAKDVSLPQRGLENDRARMGGFISTPTGQTGVEVELVREGEAWRVDRVQLAGTPLE